MIKKLFLFLLSLSILAALNCKKSEQNQRVIECYTKNNFDKVYEFIEKENFKTKSVFLKLDEIEIYLKNDNEIVFKKNGYSFSKIHRDKGVISLPILKSQNERVRNETNLLFCALLSKNIK